MKIDLTLNEFYPWQTSSIFESNIKLTKEIEEDIQKNLKFDKFIFNEENLYKKSIDILTLLSNIKSEEEWYKGLLDIFSNNNIYEKINIYSIQYDIFYRICKYTARNIHFQLKESFFKTLSEESYKYLFQKYYYNEVSNLMIQLIDLDLFIGYRLINFSFGNYARRFENSVQIKNFRQTKFINLYKYAQNKLLDNPELLYEYLMSFKPSHYGKNYYYKENLLDEELDLEKDFLEKAVVNLDSWLNIHKEKETNYHFLLLFRNQLNDEQLNKMVKRLSKLRDYDFLDLVLYRLKNSPNSRNIDMKLIDKIQSKIVMNCLR